MNGQASTTTRSEAIQRVLRRGSCPYTVDCCAHVTKHFFTRICNTAGYMKCHHFANRVGELKAPMAWLQRFAIDEERQVDHTNEAGTAFSDVESTMP